MFGDTDVLSQTFNLGSASDKAKIRIKINTGLFLSDRSF